MDRTRVVVVAAVAGLIVLTLALAYDSLTPVYVAHIDSFQRTGDPRKVVVNVTVGLADEFAERDVTEDERSVTITVHVRQPVTNKVALGVALPIVVTLQRDLGDRTVRDGSGNAIRDAGSYRGP